MVDDDELDIELRPAAEVAARCIILANVIRRLWIENLAVTAMTDDLAGEVFDIRSWLRTEGFWKCLTVRERENLSRPIGKLNDEVRAAVVWEAERLAVLGWALNLADAPAPGGLGDVDAVIRTLPSPWESTSSWVQQARLRDEAQIVLARERAEIFEWRIRVEPDRRLGSGQERTELEETIAQVAREARIAGLIEGRSDDAFTTGPIPLHALDVQELEQFAALAEARLHALNWVCGFGDSWDEVPIVV